MRLGGRSTRRSGAAGDIGANQGGGVPVVRGSGYLSDGAPERPPPLPGEPGQDHPNCGGMCAYGPGIRLGF
jgi:hypothetical protein